MLPLKIHRAIINAKKTIATFPNLGGPTTTPPDRDDQLPWFCVSLGVYVFNRNTHTHTIPLLGNQTTPGAAAP